MKTKSICFFLGLFAWLNAVAQNAQQVSIRGKVQNHKGEIVLASVWVKNLRIGQSTEPDGTFLLQLPAGKHTITVQCVGYEVFEKEIEAAAAQDLGAVILSEKQSLLNDVVVTGQFTPQSVKNSVYKVRTISQEQIKRRAATSVTAVLSTELGMRFSNDLTLGTTDVQLMGMSGQNVKVLLDGVPLVDRGTTRESLGQIDINTIERIEIVEGPMSVSYGTDALAGVINIITKKKNTPSAWTVSARLQEETASKEYEPLDGEGAHNQMIGLGWQHKGLQVSGNLTRNTFGGWQGSYTGRAKEWMPKEQYLTTAMLGYGKSRWNVWYRLNQTNETLKSLGNTYINTATKHLAATDKHYVTNRWFHQAQGDYTWNEKHSLTAALAYTDYSRETQTTDIDLQTNKRTLSLEQGAQDKATFQTVFGRVTAQHACSELFSVQHGLELNHNAATGQRIAGTPKITDLAYFISAELKPTDWMNLRPGLRFVKNSVYDAPPAIPSLNTKFKLWPTLDLRMAYARGFRSPSLSELYFTFFDSNHSIKGNTNLKAEYSNSFNTYFAWQAVSKSRLSLNVSVGGFYNTFKNLISIGSDPTNAQIYTYLNVDKNKTLGLVWNNTLQWQNLQAEVGYSRIGRYNQLASSEDLPEFVWADELNATLHYNFPKANASISFYYKYTGQLPRYQLGTDSNGGEAVHLTKTLDFHTADLTVNKLFYKYYTLTAGVKNIFDVTSINNTTTDTGAAHSSAGAVPVAYGRSYTLGILFQIH
ncbi:outer membrane receptor for ferrienterochelin and colicins [Flexibacter flexilis DSM 6793]|uniref:Outer membrane receptor for ferrienterochelin and colicins n=1 Tax=Flexibacter flexilis DSM 6793 TaxID=927664 RepID=A0A1I1DDH4_9BACT|nr:TonB-dependent receptor [Flexibacter flexilis]SFB71108.1 outer membrane receptor for ferrienterochelin and colicins [Flexibacter flexilis DSM 6793]